MNVSIELGIVFLAAFQFLFLAAFLAVDSAQYKSANRYLMFFLMGKGITLALNLVFLLNELFPPWVVSFGRVVILPMLFLYVPFLTFYIEKNCHREVKPGLSLALHFVPALIAAIYSISRYLFRYMPPIEVSLMWNLAYFLQASIYAFFAFRTIRRCQVDERDKVVSISPLTKRWLLGVIGGFTAIMLVQLSNTLVILLTPLDFADTQWVRLTAIFMLFLFANGIAYTCLKFPVLIAVKPGKLLTQRLPKSVNMEKAEALRLHMAKNQPYLNPDLKVNDVAEALDMHPRSLSLLLKHAYETNFPDFVNSYRVLNAQEMILNDTSNKTMFEILLDSGFNSKSVFNAAFKKHTGMTPSEYRRKQAA
jgi:AraC-like DNA-binding protein